MDLLGKESWWHAQFAARVTIWSTTVSTVTEEHHKQFNKGEAHGDSKENYEGRQVALRPHPQQFMLYHEI